MRASVAERASGRHDLHIGTYVPDLRSCQEERLLGRLGESRTFSQEHAQIAVLRALLSLLPTSFRSRASLQLEIVALTAPACHLRASIHPGPSPSGRPRSVVMAVPPVEAMA